MNDKNEVQLKDMADDFSVDVCRYHVDNLLARVGMLQLDIDQLEKELDACFGDVYGMRLYLKNRGEDIIGDACNLLPAAALDSSDCSQRDWLLARVGSEQMDKIIEAAVRHLVLFACRNKKMEVRDECLERFKGTGTGGVYEPPMPHPDVQGKG